MSTGVLFMRFMHLSDLHIGKIVNGFSMLEDQIYILDQILQIAAEQAVDAVLLCGDIYDRAAPSEEAVRIFDRFLTVLAADGRPVFLISGNHDSAQRLTFGSALLKERRIYMAGDLKGALQPVRLTDAYGAVDVYLLPFCRPVHVRAAFGEDAEDLRTYQEAVGYVIGRMEPDPSVRNVILAHQFVTGAKCSDSETVSVGGTDNIDASLFDAFDYAALGHIHRPQSVGRETVRYCGTPLKYSFSEAEHEKSVTIVEMREKGSVTVQTVPLTPLRDLRRIRGTYEELTLRANYIHTNTEDYLHVTLTDEEDIVDAMSRLSVIYPNIMQIYYDNRRTAEGAQVEGAAAAETKSIPELIAEFYELQNNQPMSEEQMTYVRALSEEIL